MTEFITTFWISLVVQGVIFGLACSYLAGQKNKDKPTWFVIGFLLSLIGLIMIGFAKDESTSFETVANNSSQQTLIRDNIKQINAAQNPTAVFSSPVDIIENVITVTDITDQVYLNIHMRNISDKALNAIKVTVECFDIFYNPVKNPPEHLFEKAYQDLKVDSFEDFGTEITLALMDHQSTRKVNVVIQKVLFADGSIWERGENDPVEFVANVIKDDNELRDIKEIAGDDAISYAEEKENMWICVCGRANRLTSNQCSRCKRDHYLVVTSYLKESIQQIMQQKKIEDRKRQEEITLNQKTLLENIKNRNRKMIRRALVFAPIILLLLIATYIGFMTDFKFSTKGYYSKVDEYGRNKLLQAIDAVNEPMAISIIPQLDDPNAPDNLGRTPLIEAIDKGLLTVVVTLLDNGVNAEVADKNGDTVLFRAIESNHLQIINALIDFGANIDAVDSTGHTALSKSIAKGLDETAIMLIDKGANLEEVGLFGRTALGFAIHYNNLNVAEKLIDKGANIDAVDKFGHTPLITSAYNYDLPLVRVLIENGADLTVTDNYGDSALMKALDTYIQLKLKDDGVILYLIDNGANMDIANRQGDSPITVATRNGEIELAQFMLQKGAKPTIGTPGPGGGIIFDLQHNNRGKEIMPDYIEFEDWNLASKYRAGYYWNGSSNWRLPTENELKQLEDLNLLIGEFWTESGATFTTYGWNLISKERNIIQLVRNF